MLESVSSMSGYVSRVIYDVRSKLDIDDVLQSAALDILQNPNKTLTKTKVAWCAKSSRHKAWRDARRDHDRLLSGENPNQEVHSDPLALLVKSEEIETLNRAIQMLDDDTRLAIKLRFYENQSLDEIASALGVSGSTVTRMIRKGLVMLKEVICE